MNKSLFILIFLILSSMKAFAINQGVTLQDSIGNVQGNSSNPVHVSISGNVNPSTTVTYVSSLSDAQTALTSADAASGGIVHLNCGTYTESAALTSACKETAPVQIEGSGWCTELLPQSGIDGIDLGDGSNSERGYCSVQNLRIQGTSTSWGDGVTSGVGISLRNISDFKVKNVLIGRGAGCLQDYGDATATANYSKDGLIDGNYFVKCDNFGVELNTTVGGGSTSFVNNIVISNNHFQQNQHQIVFNLAAGTHQIDTIGLNNNYAEITPTDYSSAADLITSVGATNVQLNGGQYTSSGTDTNNMITLDTASTPWMANNVDFAFSNWSIPNGTLYITNAFNGPNTYTVSSKFGNVGIGTFTEPTSRLAVNGSIVTGPNNIGVLSGPSNGILSQGDVQTQGNVGIGTTAIYPLDVVGKAGTPVITQRWLPNAPTGSGLFASITNGPVESLGESYINSGTQYISPKNTAAAIQTFSNGQWQLLMDNGLTAGNAYTPTPRVTVNLVGDVGIGTILAKNELDIAKNVSVGLAYGGYISAPTSGMLVQGNVGLGTYLGDSTVGLKGTNGSASVGPVVCIGKSTLGQDCLGKCTSISTDTCGCTCL